MRALMLVLAILTVAGIWNWVWYIQSVIKAPSDGTVAVVSASFGENCGAPKNNVLQGVKFACAGEKKCDLIFDWNLIGADPAPTCDKQFRVEWKCSSAGQIFVYSLLSEPDQGAIIPLSCAKDLTFSERD
jgi:hypothetical protein